MRKIWRGLLGGGGLFLVAVVIPTVISILYYGLMASDMYISESKFVVRTPQRQVNTGLGSLLQGAGFSKALDDAYTIHDFVLSRDALKHLDERYNLAKVFGGADFFSRFPDLDFDDSFEALHRYYQKRVTVNLDSESYIATLRIHAYTAEDAYRINESLLELSEQLVNQLNERARSDLIKFAQDEVERAQAKALKSALAVSEYRNRKAIFDPDRQSLLQLQQVSKLQDELIATKTQIAQLRSLTKDNPQIAPLQKRADTLQAEIDAGTAKVAGGDRSLSNKAAEYDRLALESAFADKLLASALTSLETARNEAQRQNLYLERIAQPNKPDVAVEPRRIRAMLTTFVLGLISWGILSLLVAGIKEHHD
jgi:capsular polysaccharide transport system permease protein